MKQFLLIVLAALTLYSCQKKEVDQVAQFNEVVFAASQVFPEGGLKSTTDDPYFPCKDLSADYALVRIGTQTYTPEVFRLDNQLYTQAIKLPVTNQTGKQSYSISTFMLMHDLNGDGVYNYEVAPGQPLDPSAPLDPIVMATPITPSAYSVYVSEPVAFSFEVSAFSKTEVPMQVLCFQNQDYSSFGFDWYAIQEIVIRKQCFFGDVCLNGDPFTPADYNGSEYGADLAVDIPAIMQIAVNVDGEPVPGSPFTNMSYQGVGQALCVEYPDLLGFGEEFTFNLDVWILNPSTGLFEYYNLYRFKAFDDGPLTFLDGTTLADTDGNGIVDFVIGTCNYTSTDYQITWPFMKP